MGRPILLGMLLVAMVVSLLAQNSEKPDTSSVSKTPADGYTVHVTAKHLVNGLEMGPFHHYCKVMTDDPVITCQIYDSADPHDMMSQVEFIVAKKLTRPVVPLAEWNKNWHDHAIEIGTGNVKVLDVSEDKAKQIADLVATTDGIIYSFEFDKTRKVPTGKIFHAQAVGHKPLTAQEYKKSANMK